MLCFEYAWRMPRVNVLLIFSLNVLVTWLMNKKLMPLTFRVKFAGSLAFLLSVPLPLQRFCCVFIIFVPHNEACLIQLSC